MHVPKRTLAASFLALAAATSIPRPAWAVVPVPQPPPVLTPVAINVAAGDQTDPHVSGDWASYTSDLSMRYYRFSTFTDAAIPLGASARDQMGDVSGSRIVFSRLIQGNRTAGMVFDAARGAAPIEIDPVPGSVRLGSAIGGDTVAFVDFGLEGSGELVIHDLVTSTSVRMTFDSLIERNPSVSPGGDIVVWEHCPSTCSILQAVKTGGTWSMSPITPDAYNPDTNGTLIVHESNGAGNGDLFWRPSAGGSEVQLEWPGFQRNPSIAGDFIAFEGGPTQSSSNDLFVYDIVNNRLFPITGTPLVHEQLNDITVLPDGSIRLVWAGDEDGQTARNVWSATLRLPNIAPTLAHSTEPGYGTDGVSRMPAPPRRPSPTRSSTPTSRARPLRTSTSASTGPATE